MESIDAMEEYAIEINSYNFPPPRFGHTINLLTRKKIVLFGGAVNVNNDKESFVMTSDVYLYDMSQLYWEKLNFQKHPKNRAVHASATIRDNKVVYYGGLSNKDKYADDGLWSFEIDTNEKAEWFQIQTTEPTPGPRYGHSMEYIHNKLFLYGGSYISSHNKKKEIMNDIWIFGLQTTNKWVKLNIEENYLLTARLYHTFSVYKKINRDNDVIILFGGRDSHNKPNKDLFSLTKIGNSDNYIWEFQTPKNKDYTPLPRFEHSSSMFGPFLFVLGGKSSISNYSTFDVFSFISCSWYCFGKVGFFRHTTWIYLNDSDPNQIKLHLYIYGGFNINNNGELNTKLLSIDIFKLFSEKESLINQLKDYLLILKNNNIIKYNHNLDGFALYNNNNYSNNIGNNINENSNRSDSGSSDDISNSVSSSDNLDNSDSNESEKDNRIIIDMLEEKIISKDIIDMAEVKRCSICLEDYLVGKYISYLPCCHYFHSECIKKWLYKSKNCPLCKTKIKVDDLKSSIQSNTS